MTKFKVGDKVKTKREGYTFSNSQGVVTDVTASRVSVNWDDPEEPDGIYQYTLEESQLYSLEPAKETYEEGKWYGWNGGECPVDGETLVEGILQDGYKFEASPAKYYIWSYKHSDGAIVAFRIVPQEKPHVFVGWGDGVFCHKEEYFSGATHKLYEDMTLEEI